MSCCCYSLYYQWSDDNVASEDRIGKFVQLNLNNKIEEYDGTRPCIGIVVKESAMIGNENIFEITRRKKNVWGYINTIDSYVSAITTILSNWIQTNDLDSILPNFANDIRKNFYGVGAQRGKSSDNSSVVQQFSDNINNYRTTNTLTNDEETYLDQLESELENVIPASSEEFKDVPSADATKDSSWDQICLLGICSVYDDGTCVVGNMCDATNNSIATAGDTWLVTQRLDTNIIEILFRF